jgi:diacylglycerol kinase (ATP)
LTEAGFGFNGDLCLQRICVIFNPAAKGERARRLRRRLDAIGAECALKPTPAAGAGRELAAEAVREGYETIVAAGGDGTVNEVVNGMGEADGGLAQCRLGILPWGTANVFAKELGLSSAIREGWEVIRRGNERLIDLPVVEWGRVTAGSPLNSTGSIQRRYFTQLAGAGFDARSVELVDWDLKKKIGFLAYVVAVFKAMRGGRTRIEVDGGAGAISGEAVLFGNGRFYGGSHKVFPNAKLDDGKLEVLVFDRVTWAVGFRFLASLMFGRLLPFAGTRCFQAASIRLASSPEAPIEVDGEAVGHLPATFSVRPKALRVVVP